MKFSEENSCTIILSWKEKNLDYNFIYSISQFFVQGTNMLRSCFHYGKISSVITVLNELSKFFSKVA